MYKKKQHNKANRIKLYKSLLEKHELERTLKFQEILVQNSLEIDLI